MLEQSLPDCLKLRGETIVGKEKLEKTKEEIASRNGDFVPTVNLDGRDLQAADLSGADLRGVSLNGASIQRASFVDTRLDGAYPANSAAPRQIARSYRVRLFVARSCRAQTSTRLCCRAPT